MAQHYPEIIGIVFLLVFAGKRGYSLRDYLKQDSSNMRKRIEELLKDK